MRLFRRLGNINMFWDVLTYFQTKALKQWSNRTLIDCWITLIDSLDWELYSKRPKIKILLLGFLFRLKIFSSIWLHLELFSVLKILYIFLLLRLILLVTNKLANNDLIDWPTSKIVFLSWHKISNIDSFGKDRIDWNLPFEEMSTKSYVGNWKCIPSIPLCDVKMLISKEF